jgi:hypothetical protein
MNTAIADAFDLAWKLAWVCRGIAADALLDSYEAERGPIGRRNVALSVDPAGGGSADGLAEDLGSVYASAWVVDDGSPTASAGAAFEPDARPGARAPHAWLSIGSERVSTLDLLGREFVLLTAGDGAPWREVAAGVVAGVAADGFDVPLRVRSVGRWLHDVDGTFASAYELGDGGAVLVRPDGIVAWRTRTAPADRGRALGAALSIALGRGTAADRAALASVTEAVRETLASEAA